MVRNKVASSLTLIAYVASSSPASAQRQPEPGPIVRAATSEGVRLAAASQARASNREPSARHASPDTDAWSGVREMESGVEITLTVKGAPAGQRYVITADEFHLTVLNVVDPELPVAAARVLIDTATERPELFDLAREGGRVVLRKSAHSRHRDHFVQTIVIAHSRPS